MKKLVLLTFALIAALPAAQAQYFTQGNLAVVRLSGYDTTSSTGAAVFIDQYTTSGTLVSSFAVPTSGANALILNGEPYEGLLNLTPDGKRLVLAGYNTALPYASNIISSESALVPRAVATLDGNGNYTIAVTTSTNFNDSAVSSAVSDGTNFWMAGVGPTPSATVPQGLNQVAYLGTGTAAATAEVVSNNVFSTGLREITLINVGGTYQMYGIGEASNSALGVFRTGAFLLSNFSGTLPTNATGSSNLFPEASPTGGGAFAYDLAINPAGTIAYLADNDNGIVRFSNTGSGWVSNYTVSLTNAQGATTAAFSQSATSVTADWTQSPPVVYATTGETYTNRLVSFQDTNANGMDTVTTLTLGTIVSGAGGVTNSYRGVRFVPGAAPVVTNQPAPVIVAAGGNATFSVGASGTAPFSYQWFSNNVAIPYGTNSSVTITNTTVAQSNTMFYVVVSNSFGTATSASAKLSVVPAGAPIVLTGPSSQTVNASAIVTFAVSVLGNNLNYQWSRNGVALTDGGTILGSATATLTINGALAANDGTYTVLASNSFGSAGAGPVTLQVNDPVITQQPVGATVLPGTSYTFSVTAAGTASLTYQWLFNGTPISGSVGGTSSSISLPFAGTYSVIVSNGIGGFVTSAPAVLADAPYLLADNFSYPNGNIVGETPPIGGAPWTENNGTLPDLVQSGRLQISATNATTDIQGLFTVPESGAVLWASFTVNLTSLPTNGFGTYFANFEDATNFTFFGRIFTVTNNAFPGTYRLGIANENNDYSYSTRTGGPSAVLPLDLAPGINYHVVYFYDLVNAYGQLWVNPASMSDVNSGPTTDFGIPTHPAAAFGFRQRQGVGTLTVGNLLASFDYNGAGSGYAAVTSNLVAAIPVVGLSPASSTNYAGNNLTMEVAASGIGLGYHWFQNGTALTDGGNISGSTTPTLSLTGLQGANQGSYYVAISNSAGTANTLTNFVTVITNATLPFFILQPQGSTNSLGGSATLTGAANGSGPLSYQWDLNGNPLSDNGTTIVGSQTPTLVLSGLTTNASGTYTLVVTGSAGTNTSQPAAIFVTPPKTVNIAFLRSLFSPVTFTPSDTTTLYQITGTVINATNETSGNTSSYYIQDSTGGINVFITNGQNFRPALGDVIQATGTLAAFDNNLEIDLDATVPNDTFGYITKAGTLTNDQTQSITNALPAATLLPWGFTSVAANIPYVTSNLDGEYIYMTNAYFVNAGGTFNSASQVTYIITNNAGLTFTLYLSAAVTNLNGLPIPALAQSVAGPLVLDETTYELYLSRYADIVTAPPLPPPFSLSAALSGNNITLNWAAVPNGTTYHVLFSTNVTGPWSTLASGLTFTSTAGTYTDTNRTAAAKFYQVASP
jgi:hypothetical protein